MREPPAAPGRSTEAEDTPVATALRQALVRGRDTKETDVAEENE